MVLVMMWATYAAGDAGWPMGGSLAFARNIGWIVIATCLAAVASTIAVGIALKR